MHLFQTRAYLRLSMLLLIFVSLTYSISEAQTIKVADFATARTLYASTYSYNLNGSSMTRALSKLTNTSNFGPGGTVTHPLNITSGLFGASGSVTAAGLAPYDILYIPVLVTPLTTAEVNAIYNWSLQPGKVVISGEQSGYSSYSAKSGYSIANGNTDPTTRVATGDNIFHLFNNGVFGNATGLTQSGSAQGYFTSDCFSAVIGKNASGNSTVIFSSVTRDIYFGDGGFFAYQSGLTGSTISSGSAITSNADKVWANTWAWAVNEVLHPGATSNSPLVVTTTPACTSGTGQITVTSPLGNNTNGEAYMYSLDGVTYQSGTTFTGKAVGTYTIYVKTASCAATSTTATITTCAGLTKSISPAEIVNGGVATYTFHIANTASGSLALSNLAFSDNLPSGIIIAPVPNVTISNGSGTVSAIAGGSTVSIDPFSVPANTTATITVDVTNVAGHLNISCGSNPDAFTNTALNIAGLSTNLINQVANVCLIVKCSPLDIPVLSASSVKASCATSTFDLTSIVTGTGSLLEFYTSDTPSPATLVSDPTAAPVGTYYAFYNNGTCISPASVAIKVSLCTFPVTLSSFTASTESGMALLNWSTTEESNAARFEIQRSLNSKDWTKVGEAVATGESNTLVNYHYQDLALPGNSSSGGTIYYRLRMIDQDDTYTYSHILAVLLERSDAEAFYPNPANEYLSLNITNSKDIGNVSILNLGGTTVKTSYDVTAEMRKTGTINLKGLQDGLYLLKMIKNDGSVRSQKIMVKH